MVDFDTHRSYIIILLFHTDLMIVKNLRMLKIVKGKYALQ
jgi:hypothetical protein